MNEITLSKEIADDVLQALSKHQDICKDEMVAAQYLIAIVGYILAANIAHRPDSDEVIAELATFLHHVYSDLTAAQTPPGAQQGQPAPQATQGGQAPPGNPADAFGIWKPGK